MATVHTNGTNGTTPTFPPARYSKVPPAITVAVAEADGPIDVEIALDDEIQDDPTELCTLLENEHSTKNTWVTVAIAYAKHKKLDVAIEVLSRASGVWARGRADDRLSILNGLCWLYLLKCREAPRVSNTSNSDLRTKEYYIQAATSVLNDAARISPAYQPLFLARGVLHLLRASLQPPSTTPGTTISAERGETLKQAAKCFDDVLRYTNGKNLMARMGKARVSYSMGKYPEALKAYQSVLESSPGLVDPDPRIGIGCCYWQLGFRDDAAGAWQRSLELSPNSKVAMILLGLYTLHLTSQLPATDPQFANLTKKAVSDYIAPSMRYDNMYPLTCATLGGWYNVRKALDKVETLSRRAIELTDVNAIASDGWYQLARKEHQQEDVTKAMDFYGRSDQARGGDDRGYIPAKFGSAQMRVLMQDYDGAKFRLEKILQQQPIIEAQTLLGTLYAEDVFAAQAAKSTDDKSAELKKALKYLEDVQKAWKDPKKKLTADPAVLLNLARLYEIDHPEKSLKCLEEVEQLELDGISEEDHPENLSEEELKQALRELLPPQLLNNMACFHYQAERYLRARELFQTALSACVKAAARDETIDTDALVTSISYNLGRTYEVEGMLDDAKGVFEGLLKRHPDYLEAQIRLAYIALRQSPNEEGPRLIKELIRDNEDHLEVRALYGWYLNKSKKKGLSLQEDWEQRHYKHTLTKSNKHDRFSLIGMGNINLTIARDMPRGTEQDKDKRHKTYERAVEFFDKVLQLDSKNAYAAQGIAIALIEDKKDYATALQILTKVKDTIKDYKVYVNLGHIYTELRQYARAIENYESALAKDRAHDVSIIACLGRVWLTRAKHEQSLAYMKTALEYSQEALKIAPGQNHLQFNVAFVQFQIAQLTYTLKDTQRSLKDVEDAQKGLDEAISIFEAVAASPNPPYPKNDIVQRAMMGRNTMHNQLQRAHTTQSNYDKENADKLQQARQLREAEVKKREETKRKAEEEAAEHRRKILEQRQKLEERDREYMERRADDERRRQELIDDSELRKAERRAKGGKGGKRKKKGEGADSESEGAGSDRGSVSGTDGPSDEERPRTKKRKLARKSEPAGKYKSAEFVESDSDGDAAIAAPNGNGDTAAAASDDEEAATAAPLGRKAARVISEDEDDEGGVAAPPANGDVAMDDEEDE